MDKCNCGGCESKRNRVLTLPCSDDEMQKFFKENGHECELTYYGRREFDVYICKGCGRVQYVPATKGGRG